MKNYYVVKEDTKKFSGFLEIAPSAIENGMILVKTVSKEKVSGDNFIAGIRLTRQQARELADQLNILADELYFESLRSQNAGN